MNIDTNEGDRAMDGSQDGISTGSQLVIFEKTYTPAALFVPGACDPVLAYIREQTKKEIIDASTEAGRKAIKSLAFKVTKTKTAIEAARLELVGAEKKRLNAIDAEGKSLRDQLDALAEEIRQPVTEFENREKDRIAKHEAAIDALKAIGVFADLRGTPYAPDTATIADRLEGAAAYDVSGFEEFTAIASGIRGQIVEDLTAKLAVSQKADADRIELERLRRAEAARQQKEREEAIAAQAKAEAEAAAERERQRVADEVANRERAAAEELARAERAKKEAEERAAQAERDRIFAAEQAERERIAAEKKAEEDRVRAEEDAKRREQEAAARERARIAAEKKAEQDAAAARERDKAHKTRINNEALAALMAVGLTEVSGKTAIAAIAKGAIPNVRIVY